jgi:predicted homoserine dehydrogenase-like protein
MDSELQVTTGSSLIGKGYITEAEGDQPGCLAALNNEVLDMGFKPLLYINMKKYLNYNPDIDSMKYWAKKSRISIEQVTSFTDGTKVEIEQVLVANGLGADILPEGMIGGDKIYDEFVQGATSLAEVAKENGIVMSDFLMCRNNSAAGVFIVAEHNEFQSPYLAYYKLGDGPYYILERPYHLCHLEIIKTLKNVVNGMPPLLTNSSSPTYSVAAIAKRTFKSGDRIERGMGSFDVRGRGIAIDSCLDHVPIGLLFDAQIKREIPEGEILRFDDLILPESEALEIWKKIVGKDNR